MGSNKQTANLIYGATPDISGEFAQIPIDIFEEQAFQNLKQATRCFYLLLLCHRHTRWQCAELKETLTKYRDIYKDLDIKEDDKDLRRIAELTDFDIDNEAFFWKKSAKYTSAFFVIPEKQYKRYGYQSNHVYQLKKELIEAGFIREICGGKVKKKGDCYRKLPTLYQFSTDWIKIDSSA